jgi:hypothetical protein
MDAGKRPQAAEIVEFLANNPRIVSPCLDSKYTLHIIYQSQGSLAHEVDQEVDH